MIYKFVLLIVISIIYFIINFILKKFINVNNYLHQSISNIFIEKFENNQNIIFIKEDELLNILKNNKDGYYNTFFKNDYISRKIKSTSEYYDKIEKSVSTFSDEEKKKIIFCINNIDKILHNINLPYFNGINSVNIPWKIGCINGKLYENGLPHTRSDIIIISKEDVNLFSNNKIMKTLLHEKIHLYQKEYPNDVLKYLEINNFSKFKKRDEKDNVRSNPDLDNWIYKNKDNEIFKAMYKENPESIEDIEYFPTNNQSYEHPFEKMAIEFEKYII